MDLVELAWRWRVSSDSSVAVIGSPLPGFQSDCKDQMRPQVGRLCSMYTSKALESKKCEIESWLCCLLDVRLREFNETCWSKT